MPRMIKYAQLAPSSATHAPATLHHPRPLTSRTGVRAKETRPASTTQAIEPATTRSGLNANAETKSPPIRAIPARVPPHVGHGIPVDLLNMQRSKRAGPPSHSDSSNQTPASQKQTTPAAHFGGDESLVHGIQASRTRLILHPDALQRQFEPQSQRGIGQTTSRRTGGTGVTSVRSYLAQARRPGKATLDFAHGPGRAANHSRSRTSRRLPPTCGQQTPSQVRTKFSVTTRTGKPYGSTASTYHNPRRVARAFFRAAHEFL